MKIIMSLALVFFSALALAKPPLRIRNAKIDVTVNKDTDGPVEFEYAYKISAPKTNEESIGKVVIETISEIKLIESPEGWVSTNIDRKVTWTTKNALIKPGATLEGFRLISASAPQNRVIYLAPNLDEKNLPFKAPGLEGDLPAYFKKVQEYERGLLFQTMVKAP